MTDAPGGDSPASLSTWSSKAKFRNAVQRNVTALLNALAPERAPARADRVKMTIEEHRTPSGCVLQSADAALSVSWFADSDGTIGELQVVLWRGIVTRRGAAAPKARATVAEELLFTPIEHAVEDRIWRGADGVEYDSASLAAHCLSLLERQMRAG